jgi:hypothetical protein
MNLALATAIISPAQESYQFILRRDIILALIQESCFMIASLEKFRIAKIQQLSDNSINHHLK